MNFRSFLSLVCLTIAASASFANAQSVPDDPNHLPRKIGSDDKAGTIIVSGKITLDGLPVGQPKPAVYVAAYINGRLIVRRQAAESGSFILNEVPRGESVIVVEIDHADVASRQLNYTPTANVYQDFTINWTQVVDAKTKSGVVTVRPDYQRKEQDQDRFDHALSDIKKGKNDAAISGLKAILANDPKDFEAWSQLGNAYFLNKDTKNAESAHLKAIAAKPDHTYALVNLGKLYLSQNENDKAIDILSKSVAADPASPDAQQYLGESYLAVKKGSKAVGYLNEAIRLAPLEKAEVHLRLAALYHAAGLKRKASAEYQKFLGKVPEYARRDELKEYIAENPPSQ